MNTFDKIFNITSATNTNTSIAKALLIFYVLMASQQNNLLGKQMKELINDSRIAQHIIAFIMMIVVINMIGGVQETDKLLFYSAIAYVWFVLSTKLDIQWNLILILLLFVWFLYQNRNDNKRLIMDRDINITNEIKKAFDIKDINWNTYVVSGLVTVTLIGLYLYSNKKGVQYGGGKYDPIKFLLY